MTAAVPSSSVPSNDDYLDPSARAALAGSLLPAVMTLKGGIARLTARVNGAHTDSVNTVAAPTAPSASHEDSPAGPSASVDTVAAPAAPGGAPVENNPEGPALPVAAKKEELSADEVSSLLNGLGSPANVPGQ